MVIDYWQLMVQSLIYFLFGEATEQRKMVVYIGKTEDALKRIGEHIQNPKKDYWTEVIVFISKDDNLNKANIKCEVVLQRLDVI